MKNLTLVIPAKNESESLPIVLNELKSLDCKILVSLKNDDISTIESIKNHNVKIHFNQSQVMETRLLRLFRIVIQNYFVYLMQMDHLIKKT